MNTFNHMKQMQMMTFKEQNQTKIIYETWLFLPVLMKRNTEQQLGFTCI